MRSSELFGNVLNGINVASIGLMAAVSVRLATDAVTDPLTALVAVAAGLLLWRTTLNSAWLIGGGAVTGIAHTLLA
jgi:chromate transporter